MKRKRTGRPAEHGVALEFDRLVELAHDSFGRRHEEIVHEQLAADIDPYRRRGIFKVGWRRRARKHRVDARRPVVRQYDAVVQHLPTECASHKRAPQKYR